MWTFSQRRHCGLLKLLDSASWGSWHGQYLLWFHVLSLTMGLSISPSASFFKLLTTEHLHSLTTFLFSAPFCFLKDLQVMNQLPTHDKNWRSRKRWLVNTLYVKTNLAIFPYASSLIRCNITLSFKNMPCWGTHTKNAIGQRKDERGK